MADQTDDKLVSFGPVRDVAVRVAQVSLLIDVDMLDAVIAEAERALDSGVIDPMVHDAAPVLRRQLEFMRTFRDWRRAIEPYAQEEVVA